MKPGDTTKLRREVKATAIPSGSPLSLPADTEVTLTQSLGGSHTVAGSFGLARIEEKDQDGLTCSGVTTRCNSQLAICWLEIRSVARSSIKPTL